MGIEWLQVAVNVMTVLVAVGSFAAWYKGYLISEVKFAVNEQMVTKSEYDKDKSSIMLEISQIKKFDTEFAVLKTRMEHLQGDATEIKQVVGGLSGEIKGLSKEITGAITRVAELAVKVSN